MFNSDVAEAVPDHDLPDISEETFREWLREEIGKYADVGFTRVDFSASLMEMGLSSFQIVRLSGEIEKRLGIELDATSMREFATIDDLCQTVLRMRDGKRTRRAGTPVTAPLPVVVAATFTAEPIHDPLNWALRQAGFAPDIRFARYNQVFQELLNEQSLIGQTGSGFVIIALRIEDWFRYGGGGDTAARAADLQAADHQAADLQNIARTVEDFIAALQGAAARAAARFLVVLAPHSPPSVRRLAMSASLTALDQRIVDGALAIPKVDVIDLRRIEDSYRHLRVLDETRDELGHIPFTQSAFVALGLSVARRCVASQLGPAKVIVLDCDNTLWGGVCGEDGPGGVRTDGPFAAFHDFLVEQQQAGKVLCLCSKNNEDDALKTFAAHPGMALRLDHIAAHRINWLPKSENIRALAAELDLGLDSFVFIDDSAIECAEVAEALPDVAVIHLPADPAHIAGLMRHHWLFDSQAVTDEDRRRTEMYRQNAGRRTLQSTATSFEDFLARLDLVVDIADVEDGDIARVAQLTQRTNQFNARKLVHSEGEIAALRAAPDRVLCRVKVKDRFGDYGLVGVFAGRVGASGLVCDIFLMSCRVLGRGVEQAMIRRLGGLATARGCTEVVVEVERTARNAVALAFFDSLGAGVLPKDAPRGEIRWAPGDTEVLIAGAVRQTQRPDTAKAGETVAPGARALAAPGLTGIARCGDRLDVLLTRIDASNSTRRPALATEYVTPRNAWEKKIAGIWRDVLRLDQVGIYDNFFELGGDSLRAAEAFARMWDMGVPDSISIQTMENPTVADLARAIEDVRQGHRPSLISDKFSLAAEGGLAEDIRLPGNDVAAFDRPMDSVFLTGGTGYLGAYLMHELLAVSQARVTCLVRAATPEEGRQRIVANLRRYNLWRPDLDTRIDIVLGDLGEPLFGLSEAGFAGLAARIDTIFHSGAWVNFVYPYHHLKKVNVDATDTVLRLAIASAPTPIQVHFISTLGVIMSTGYGRETPILETDPLVHADDLLNGYEQSKYASDKMVWTACQERGIPCAIYRPGMVSGLSNGVYHKTDEFLPQFIKGCLQLGSFPMIDSLWQIAPVDFVTRSIVHIARNPANLNCAYFVLHPDARPFAEHIEWHKRFGYEVRALPWDVWKRELLGLGTGRLRKNALFPFIDFIRALSQEQVYFPPTDIQRFARATADLGIEVVPQLELMERYTRHFIQSGFYDKLPSGPTACDLRERDRTTEAVGVRGDMVDERLRFDPTRLDSSEAYYLLWTDAARGLSMVVRYVLHNGPVEEAKIAEVWCWFRDRHNDANDIAIRQRYPLGRAEIVNTEAVRLMIGPSGYGARRIWGEVTSGAETVTWDFQLDPTHNVGIERIVGMDAHELFPHFQSNAAKTRIAGRVVANGVNYEVSDQLASDGHYWNTKNLRAWSWGHCSDFDGDTDFIFEGVAARFNDWSQPCTWLTFVYKGVVYRSTLVDAFYTNQELHADLTSWRFVAERGRLRFVGTLTARTADQILIVHPLPDDECLYTHITYTGDMAVDIQMKEAGRWWTVDKRAARGTASFEVTRKVRNEAVRREFQIVRAG
jgi:FkbH-like protein/thioester reductase-like protein